ncbi:MAG: phosphotransferase [Rhodobacteraceae bacterium]|nr:phosphotransferase [Paracoccaceae bacterium]
MDEDDINKFCKRHWDGIPESISWPGGKGRKAAVVKVSNNHFVIAKRRSTGRATLEARVLSQLAVSNLVPELLFQDEEFIVQELIDGRRLTWALEVATSEDRQLMLIDAGSGLLSLQEKAKACGLQYMVPKIGVRPGWVEDFAQTPLRAANLLGVLQPDYDVSQIIRLMERRSPAFVKWDARPGNAIVQQDGTISWFDWEHCGVGSVEDDLVWLFADEWSPISEAAEDAILDQAAATHGVSLDELSARFRIKAVLHTLIRLILILDRKGDGPWWSIEKALEYDRVGVSQPHVHRLCKRALRWADQTKELRCLHPLFDSVGDFANRL